MEIKIGGPSQVANFGRVFSPQKSDLHLFFTDTIFHERMNDRLRQGCQMFCFQTKNPNLVKF
jgi:hypothetical protein